MNRSLLRSALVVCSALLGALGAEWVVRAAGWAPQVLKIRPGIADSAFRLSEDPILGYVLKTSYRHSSPNNIENVAYTNAHGQRDVEREYARKPGIPRILLVGDSVVMGLGLASIDETISRRMEEHWSGKVEVLNFGVAGYCTRGQVRLIETEGVRYDPDLVIVVFVDNDYEDANSQTSYYNYDRPAWSKRLFLASDAFRVAAIRNDWFHFRAEVDRDYALERHRSALGEDNVRRGVELLRELADEHGFRVLIAIWPSFQRDGILDRPGPHELDPDTGSLRIERLARESGLETVRLSGPFQTDWQARQPQAGASDPERFYTRDATTDIMHPNATGARVAAGILVELIEAHGLLAQ